MKRAVVVLELLLCLGRPAPPGAHHIGVFIPKDDDITKNFKDIKFAGQAGRFDLALRLFDDGIGHATMEKNERRLPRGLEDGLRAALKARDLPGAELRLTIFLVFMTRERVAEALNRLKIPEMPSARRREHARKVLTAAWRYYNLADFVVSAQDPKTAAALRIGFEDAQTFLGGMMVDPMWAGAASAKPTDPDEPKAAAVLAGMLDETSRFIARAAAAASRGEAGRVLPRR